MNYVIKDDLITLYQIDADPVERDADYTNFTDNMNYVIKDDLITLYQIDADPVERDADPILSDARITQIR